MTKQKEHTQPAATQAPIFMNETDGKWYFREKYLNCIPGTSGGV